MPKLSTSEYIRRANDKLKRQNISPRIEQRGGKLVLRATLPPKPSSAQERAYQQRLSTGLTATPHGVGEAEKLAKTVDAQLCDGSFSWNPYLKHVQGGTIESWAKALEKDYFSRRARTPKTETTWDTDYRRALRKLPPDQEISGELLLDTIVNHSEPDTRTRKRLVMVYSALAKFAGVECSLGHLKGSYGPTAVQPQDVPTDEQIIKAWKTLTSIEWRWVMGILAAYGIRPSEIAHCTVDDRGILTVADGKTGGRRVWPLFPEWVDQFDLKGQRLPDISGKNNSVVGNRVSQYLSRHDIPFTAKAPRKAWCVRAILFGVPVELAAQQQGHSVAVHCQMYARWITEESQQRVYDAIMSRPDRPLPPATEGV